MSYLVFQSDRVTLHTDWLRSPACSHDRAVSIEVQDVLCCSEQWAHSGWSNVTAVKKSLEFWEVRPGGCNPPLCTFLSFGSALKKDNVIRSAAELTGWAADPLSRSARPFHGGGRRCISVKPVCSSWPCGRPVSLTTWGERRTGRRTSEAWFCRTLAPHIVLRNASVQEEWKLKHHATKKHGGEPPPDASHPAPTVPGFSSWPAGNKRPQIKGPNRAAMSPLCPAQEPRVSHVLRFAGFHSGTSYELWLFTSYWEANRVNYLCVTCPPSAGELVLLSGHCLVLFSLWWLPLFLISYFAHLSFIFCCVLL